METVDRRNDDLDAGLAGLSIVVMARRFDTGGLLTLDERDLQVLEPLQGGAFTLLPADA